MASSLWVGFFGCSFCLIRLQEVCQYFYFLLQNTEKIAFNFYFGRAGGGDFSNAA
jgi:hypothetical protein